MYWWFIMSIKPTKFIWRYVHLLRYRHHKPPTCFGHLLQSSSGRCISEGMLQRMPKPVYSYIVTVSHAPLCLQQPPQCQIVKPFSYPQLPSAYPSSNCHIVLVIEMSVGGLKRAPKCQYRGDIATSQSPDPQGLSSSDTANSLTDNY